MRDRYTFINSSVFKGGLVVPLYRVFTDEGVTYEAVVYERNVRGSTIKKTTMRGSKTEVCKWREGHSGG